MLIASASLSRIKKWKTCSGKQRLPQYHLIWLVTFDWSMKLTTLNRTFRAAQIQLSRYPWIMDLDKCVNSHLTVSHIIYHFVWCCDDARTHTHTHTQAHIGRTNGGYSGKFRDAWYGWWRTTVSTTNRTGIQILLLAKTHYAKQKALLTKYCLFLPLLRNRKSKYAA